MPPARRRVDSEGRCTLGALRLRSQTGKHCGKYKILLRPGRKSVSSDSGHGILPGGGHEFCPLTVTGSARHDRVEDVPGLVELEVAVPRSAPASR